MSRKTVTTIIGAIILFFMLSISYPKDKESIKSFNYSSPLANPVELLPVGISCAARRVHTPMVISPITKSWEDFLRSIISEAFPEIKNQNWNELSLLGDSFLWVKQHGITSISNWLSMVVRRLFPYIRNQANVSECALAIYNEFQKYEITNISDASGVQSITFQIRSIAVETAEVIDPEDVAIEQYYLEQQREKPYDLKTYGSLELLYQELLQKYPQHTYYYWQLSWIWGIVGKPEMRRAIFVDGANREISLLPEYYRRFKLANIIQDKRGAFSINWGSYEKTDRASLEAHALKYLLLFPEIFMPQEIPIEPTDKEAFALAVNAYKKRAEDIIRAAGVMVSGLDERWSTMCTWRTPGETKFYVFARNGIYEPLYLAYRPDSQEVVGFRIEPSKIRDNYCIAIDTFYKASGNMIEALEKSNRIELLLDTTITDPNKQITVPYDSNQDSFQEPRLKEQAEEFKNFGLTETMFDLA
ncbi:MAG: hypothetical protein NTZ48_02125, partial [Candidatus Omnitrophica bacterium]|nr:hypothetical protein [Candidatus Omnitrophota bacterium]